MSKKLCIYHNNCMDGFAAAYAVWLRFKNKCEYLPANYGDLPPDVTDKEVFLVDFSYKRPVILDMLNRAKSVTILDHHKTAIEDLSDLLLPSASTSGFASSIPSGLSGVLDASKSGAVITWEYFHPSKPIPKLFEHIQDRDLWKFEYPSTRDIHMALTNHEFSFENWHKIISSGRNKISELKQEGRSLNKKFMNDLRYLLEMSKRKLSIAGHIVPAANLNYIYASEAGNIMAKGEAFAAIYYDTPNGRGFSLRSSPDGMDVSEIAKMFGGGGHKHAAGFSVSFEKALEFEIK